MDHDPGALVLALLTTTGSLSEAGVLQISIPHILFFLVFFFVYSFGNPDWILMWQHDSPTAVLGCQCCCVAACAFPIFGLYNNNYTWTGS